MQVREARPVLARHELHEVALDLHRILLLREAEPLREPPHVRVDDDPLRLAELGRDDVRRLARDAGQADELVDPARHLAVELLEQHAHRAADRLRLLPVEAGREDVAARAPPAARRGSPRAAVLLTKSFSVTRLTFTSVVCAESITETSSSSGLRNVSAIVASACSTASRSMIGRIRSRFGPTRFRASLTKLRGNELERVARLTQARACADEVERRAAGACELARRRPELAGLDPRDRGRELRLELGDVGERERRRFDRLVGRSRNW